MTNTEQLHDLGLEKLKAYLDEGEKFVTNARRLNLNDIAILPRGRRTADQIVSDINNRGERTAHIIDHAFDIHGNELPGLVAVVAKLKQQK